MDENKSTSKRGNSLNEDERKIANMDESDFFFLLMESICGFVYVGDVPPELCPVCKVPSRKLERIGG